MIANDSIKIVDYLDGFQIEFRGSRTPKKRRSHKITNSEQYAGGVLQFFPHPEGYVKATSAAATPGSPPSSYLYDYVYNYTDHLGNIRLSYSKDPATNELKIMDENHYYPFGLKHSVYSTGSKKDYKEDPGGPGGTVITNVMNTEYLYKYNGFEYQDELGLGLYDYQWRNYDPALGRWNVIDPMAPKYFSHSTYAYALNNPVYFIDPDGMQVTGGPDDPIYEDEIIELETAVIVNSAPKKTSNSSGFSLAYLPSINMTDFVFGRDGRNSINAAYKNMLSPENIDGYKKMQQAKREGEMFAVGVMAGSIVAIYAAPAVVAYGSIYAETQVGSYVMQSTGRFALDITAKALFSGGDISTSDVTSAMAGALVPGKAWYLSGFAAEGTGLATDAALGEIITSDEVIGAGIKSFMVSPLGTASGNAMEAVTGSAIAGEAINAIHTNASGAIIDNEIKH